MAGNPKYDGRLHTQAEVDRLVLEARIDEVNNIENFYGSHEDYQSMWEHKRITELQARLDELKEK